MIHCILILASLCTPTARSRMILLGVDVIAKTLDYRQSERAFSRGNFSEYNPVIRPLLGHPLMLSGFGAAYLSAAALMGYKMSRSRSRVIRDLNWLPQALSLGQNVAGYVYTHNKLKHL